MARIASIKDVTPTFRAYLALPQIQNYISKNVVCLYSDGGTEHKPIMNIIKTSTAPYMPQPNQFSELINRTILEPAHRILENPV